MKEYLKNTQNYISGSNFDSLVIRLSRLKRKKELIIITYWNNVKNMDEIEDVYDLGGEG